MFGDAVANGISRTAANSLPRMYDGILKGVLTTDGRNGPASEPFVLADVEKARGALGARLAGNAANLVLVSSMRGINALLADTRITALNVIAPDGGVRTGYMQSVNGVRTAVVDELNITRNADGVIPANANTKSVAVLANTRMAKQGFTRNFSVKQVPQALSDLVVVSFRWGFAIGTPTAAYAIKNV